MITELPDLCLRKIFDLIDLDGLINCYEVFDGWKPIILKRLAGIKYLLPENGFHGVPANAFKDNQQETISLNNMKIKSRCHAKQLQNLLPNLRIFTITREMNESSRIHRSFIENNQSIRGLVFSKISRHSLVLRSCTHCPNIEFIALDMELKLPQDSVVCEISSQIKQIYQTRDVDFSRIFKIVPNLIRLHTSTYKMDVAGNNFTDAPRINHERVFENIEILEIYLYRYGRHEKSNRYFPEGFNKYGFKYFNHCPALKSVYLEINNIYDNADKVATNRHMQDLVLSYSKKSELSPKENVQFEHNWSTLRVLLTKFPNLKHLAIRDNTKIKDGDIRELIEILPNLILLDLRESTGITYQSINYVAGYCVRKRRNLKIYIDSNIEQIKVDWPNLSTDYLRVCKGFDFMKHCFLKPFKYLPYFLIPED